MIRSVILSEAKKLISERQVGKLRFSEGKILRRYAPQNDGGRTALLRMTGVGENCAPQNDRGGEIVSFVILSEAKNLNAPVV